MEQFLFLCSVTLHFSLQGSFPDRLLQLPKHEFNEVRTGLALTVNGSYIVLPCISCILETHPFMQKRFRE